MVPSRLGIRSDSPATLVSLRHVVWGTSASTRVCLHTDRILLRNDTLSVSPSLRRMNRLLQVAVVGTGSLASGFDWMTVPSGRSVQ